MTKEICTEYQKKFFPKFHDMNIYTNIMYFIPSIIAVYYSYSKYNKMAIKDRCDKNCLKDLHILGWMGLIVTLISCIHHTYNEADLTCKEYVKPTLFRIISGKLDVYCAIISSLFGLYLIYKRKKFNKIFFLSFILINIFSFTLFFHCLNIEKKIAKIKNKDSQEYLTGLSEYSFYHAYWHVLGGFSFTLIVYYLTN